MKESTEQIYRQRILRVQMYIQDNLDRALTLEELAHTRELLAEKRVPSPRNPKPADDNQDAEYECMRCSHHWAGYFSRNAERTCPECRSNSVRWLRVKR